MRTQSFFSIFWYSSFFCFLAALGCAAPSVLEDSQSLSNIVRKHKHIKLYGDRPGMVNTGIYLNKGDAYSIFATGSVDLWPAHLNAPPDFKYHDVRPEHGWPFMARFGDKTVANIYFCPLKGGNASTQTAWLSGDLYLGIRDGPVDFSGEPLNPEYYNRNGGSFNVDIIVWKTDDWAQIAEFFQTMREKYPDNEPIIHALEQANRYKELFIAEKETTEEIQKAEKEIAALKEESRIKEKVDVKTHEKLENLEGKLAKLTITLAQLEEMRKQLDEERMKTSLLSRELEEKEKREKELLTRLEDTSKTPPIIAIASPMQGSKVDVKTIIFSGVAEDEKGLQNLEVFVNDQPLQKEIGRGIRLPEKRYPKRIDFRERISLRKGENKIKIRAVDSDGLSSEKVVTVQYIEKRRNVWAVVIGIDHYPNIRQLKYAVGDAEMFYDHLVKYNRIPPENVTLLTDQQATLRKVKSTLGTDLKNKAGKEDMVIIFFAGHGATEKDVMSPDGDGLEKYLLPYDADPRDLYATALPMREISRVFRRVRSERLVFIADSCYSGASGGRTVGITDIRANLSEAFLDRIASGKGRVILTASGPNEVSAEKDELKHGVFSYYLVEGLKGRADSDKDGLISLDELYRYVSHKVPEATGQEQHPVKKGTVEGRLILGVIQ